MSSQEIKVMSKRMRYSNRYSRKYSTKKNGLDFYAKYPHVVRGSIREATAKDERKVGHSHKRVCDIKCTVRGCGIIRTVNTQDVFQVARCKEHQAEQLRKYKREYYHNGRKTA